MMNENKHDKNTELAARNNLTGLMNALPGSCSVNTVKHATIEEVVFSVGSTDAPIRWLDVDHVVCVYCRSMSVPRLYK
jgi:hypothetical protein